MNTFQLFSLVTYWLVCPIDSNKEEKFCHKQADAQVLMDSVSVTLQSAEEAESKNADQETDKGQKNADPSDDIQYQIMDCISMLQIILKKVINYISTFKI